ncbi:unnamed protein product, partial [Adineta steineri]
RICIRSKITWIIFAIVIVAIITIPTAIILTKNKNDVETNSTSIMMITTEKESITSMFTTTTTEPATATTKETSSTTTTTEPSKTTTTEPSLIGPPVLISLESIDGIVHGVYNTMINQDSNLGGIGCSSCFYPEQETPAEACGGNIYTKFLSFGSCENGEDDDKCGLNSGFYLELKRGASLVTGIQICTADDFPERDPLHVSLEGSNQSGSDLDLGISWTLLYNGNSGLKTDPDRHTCGIVQQISNSIRYKSYQFLVSSKRDNSDSVQYSELQLFGY